MRIEELESGLPGGLDWQRGDVFPDVRLPTVDEGGPRRLSEWRGRPLMLHLFASW